MADQIIQNININQIINYYEKKYLKFDYITTSQNMLNEYDTNLFASLNNKDHIKIIDYLINNNKSIYPILVWSCLNKCFSIIKYIIEKCQIEIKDINNAFELISLNNCTESIKYLMPCITDIETIGNSLIMATDNDNDEIVMLLFNKYEDLIDNNTIGNVFTATNYNLKHVYDTIVDVLIAAACNNNIEIVKFLLETKKQAITDVDIEYTFLSASTVNSIDVIQYLRQYIKNENIINEALSDAREYECQEVIQYLEGLEIN